MLTLKHKFKKPKNLVAKDLRSPKYKMRVVVSKKRYNRKNLKEDFAYGYEAI